MNKDINRLRFNEMRQTGKAVRQEVQKLRRLLHEMHFFHNDRGLEIYCLRYLEEKISGKPLRAYFSRKMYEYLSDYPVCEQAFLKFTDSNNLFFRKLPFVFEVVITIQYLDNQILDEKLNLGRRNHDNINQNLISGNILRELLFVYIKQEVAYHFHDSHQLELFKQYLHRLLYWVDIGQFMDKEYNRYKYWESEMPLPKPAPYFDDIFEKSIRATISQVQKDVPGKDIFIEAYFKRIYLTNVYFFRCITEVLIEMSNHRYDYAESLQFFSVQYGFMLQLINDYADFVYSSDIQERKRYKTAGKKSTDFFADLYNFNITLPLIYHLNKGADGKIEKYLNDNIQRKSILNKYPKQIMQEIWKSDSINETVLRSIELSDLAKGLLDKENKHSAFFIHMCDMANDNKYYRFFINNFFS